MRFRLNVYIPPAREVSPTVVLIPARLLLLVGHVMLPSVSVPSVTAARPMDAAMPEPEEEPHGSAFGKYAFVACPPRPDQPDARLPRKCAHSDKFALPGIWFRLIMKNGPGGSLTENDGSCCPETLDDSSIFGDYGFEQ